MTIIRPRPTLLASAGTSGPLTKDDLTALKAKTPRTKPAPPLDPSPTLPDPKKSCTSEPKKPPAQPKEPKLKEPKKPRTTQPRPALPEPKSKKPTAQDVVAAVRCAMLAKAATSLLSPAQVKLLKLTPYAEGHDLKIFPQWAGFQIPYFLPDGSLDPAFYRFRYTQTKPSKGFASLTEEPKKPRRYTQPAGTGCGVYLPPLLPVAWTEIARDPKTPVVITEGELKAACACALGIATVGLGGVYSWRSAKDLQELLPALEVFTWVNRNVVICFDSDIAKNAMVRLAASQLACVLARRGALVAWTAPPPGPEDSKQGLDDYAYAHRATALETLVALVGSATPIGPGIDLHKMNTEVALIRATSEIVELATGNVYSAANFSEVLYKPRTYTVQETAEAKPVRKFTAKEWLTWPLRTEVSALEYDPSADTMLTPAGAYNTWHAQRWPLTPVKGSIAPWQNLFDHVFAATSIENRIWALRWFAYPIQHPGVKLSTAMLIWGRQTGTGKTFLGSTMACIYGKNYGTVNNAQLAGSFNEWSVDKQFILGDEISLGDKRATANSLKDMITRETLRINIKNRKTYSIRDCINYYFTSNHEDAVYLESHDRRIFVHHCDTDPLPLAEYRAYDRWLREEGGAARLFDYFLTLDLGDWDPYGRAPATAAKIEMTASGRGDTEDWACQLASDPDSVLPLDRWPYALWRTQDLLAVYDPDKREKTKVGGMSRALGAAGVTKIASGNNSAVVDGVRARLWAVRAKEKYRHLGPAEAARIYAAERAAAPRGVGATAKFAAGQRVQ